MKLYNDGWVGNKTEADFSGLAVNDQIELIWIYRHLVEKVLDSYENDLKALTHISELPSLPSISDFAVKI